MIALMSRASIRPGAGIFGQPLLTPWRVRLAFITAIVADLVQMLLGPLGWALFDEVTDVVTLILVSRLIGYHPLFLPTFVIEFIPIADMLPTWTACVAVVVALRRKRAATAETARAPEPPPDVIDV